MAKFKKGDRVRVTSAKVLMDCNLSLTDIGVVDEYNSTLPYVVFKGSRRIISENDLEFEILEKPSDPTKRKVIERRERVFKHSAEAIEQLQWGATNGEGYGSVLGGGTGLRDNPMRITIDCTNYVDDYWEARVVQEIFEEGEGELELVEALEAEIPNIPKANFYLLNDSDFIGIQYEGGARGFVVKLEKGSYAVVGVLEGKTLNNFGDHCYITLQNTIQELLHDRDIEAVFSFDTHTEMYNWLGKQKVN